MKTPEQINDIMMQIPEDARYRWCEGGPCACMGCVQTFNKQIIIEKQNKSKYLGDPEYISYESLSPRFIKKYQLTKDEWKLWTIHNPEEINESS